MIEILIFLVALVILLVSYKIGSGEWFSQEMTSTEPASCDPVPPRVHHDPSTVATSVTRAVL